jgi:hypothetical protein
MQDMLFSKDTCVCAWTHRQSTYDFTPSAVHARENVLTRLGRADRVAAQVVLKRSRAGGQAPAQLPTDMGSTLDGIAFARLFRQRKIEPGARAGLRLGPSAAAMSLNDSMNDGQADTGALEFAG